MKYYKQFVISCNVAREHVNFHFDEFKEGKENNILICNILHIKTNYNKYIA